ncbi:MAG: DNA ligase D [Syntrophaceae bacterium]
MSLDKYREKRDFKKTPEPSGKTKAKAQKTARKPLSFVVHKHSASHLHYDLRLEFDGVLKSWAIPKRPTLDPGEKRLAMMVEDHPLDYGSFEGIIPQGNYGAGTVMIWDEGPYHAAHHEDRGESEEELRQGLEKGHISIFLEGKRLKGEFALVKIKRAGDNSWLMIKKHDEFSGPGNNGPEDQDRSAETGRTMEEIAAGNVAAHSVKAPRNVDLHGAPKEAMPADIKPMLATLVDGPFDRTGWIFEIKWDGYRALAEMHGGQVRLYSRNGKPLNRRFPSIVESLKQLPFNALLDGEVVIVDENGRADFQLLQNYMKTGQGNLVYYVFDILHFRGHNLMDFPLRRRKMVLSQVIPLDPPLPHVRISEHIENNGISLFNAVAQNNIEGIVAKDGASPYRPGVRSREWLKVKTAQQQEAVVGGFTEPRGGRKFFGALLLGVYEDGELVYIGHTGGGFTDEGLREMRARMDPLKTDKSPFKVPPKGHTEVTWVRPELVCEVRFTEWTNEGLLRHPIFMGLREDKKPREVRRELPKPSEEVVPQSMGGRFRIVGDDKKIIEIGGRRLEITNLDKVFWPEEGYTKGDLIEYYRAVAAVILPHLHDRPESLRRNPNGIEGDSFFQKDVAEVIPDWIETVDVRSESEDKQIKFMLCQDEATLIYMANLGCIEINPWNARYRDPDNPDYVVLDLDPLDIDFRYVVEAALVTREVLDEAGVKGYCKTSGATGLHIFIPVQAKYSTIQVQQFAQLINTIVHARIPRTTSLERMPGRRAKKVYLDFLQNRRGQTMAAAYCVRPYRGATVSAPLAWDEVNESLDPRMFHIRNMPDRIKEKGDIWKPVIGRGIDMEICLDRIGRMQAKAGGKK